MRILLLPAGSHGDVHPFVGVGLRLKERGHDVVLACSGNFAELAQQVGLAFHEIGTADEFHRLSTNPDIWHPRKAAPLIAREAILPGMDRQFAAIEQLAAPGDTVLVGSALGFGTPIAHEKLKLPFVSLHLQPTMFWSVHQSPILAPNLLLGDRVPRWFKQWQFNFGMWMAFNRHLLKPVNAYRALHGLAPIRSAWDMMSSPQRISARFPEWFAPRQPDWPLQTVFTGFPRWDEKGVTRVDPALATFLDEGDPPIAFTPGSAHNHAHFFWEAAIDACRRLNRRGLLFTRHVDQIPKNLPPSVKHFAYAPFSEVLPRCAALVYHGGIGTLSQALAAGIPHIIMPLAHDQPDNVARIKRLGVGDAVWPRKFRGPNLAAALERLLSSSEVAQRCRNYAARLTDDDGIGKTCDAIEPAAEWGRHSCLPVASKAENMADKNVCPT
jgi:UDP:flavonoid glycosyltransferase YjiC (YdhE family)